MESIPRDTNFNELLPDDHVAGERDAPVTVIGYCDFECPYCGEAYPLLRSLRTDAPDRVRYVFRHFPLANKHPAAWLAAEAAEAAAAQGRFWDMHDVLFENQDDLDREGILELAEELGFDLDRFQDDVDRHRHAGRVARDVRTGAEAGVTGTPTLFVNGRIVEVESLRAAIDGAAAEQSARSDTRREAP
jgi:protein-disulfide isomerase